MQFLHLYKCMKKIVFVSCFDIYLEFKSSGLKCTFTDSDGEYVLLVFTSRYELFSSAGLIEELSKRVKTYAFLIGNGKRHKLDGGGDSSLLSSSDTRFLHAYISNDNRKGVCIDARISRNSYRQRLEKIMRILRIETEDALRLWALSRFSI